MPDFNKGSTFNKDANFQGVKFGADAPLLETELNELQDIQTEARADIVRDSIPSGFTQLGELDFDYMLNNENCVKLKTDSVAYVNGYKINIPKDTLINIGKAPEKDAREDLVFLEVWKEEVTKDSQLTVAGGEGQAHITNNMLDSRVNQETSRRVALKWRIRHCSNVDFVNFPEGLGTLWVTNKTTISPTVTPQGGMEAPLNMTGFAEKDVVLYGFRYQGNKNLGNLKEISSAYKTFDGGIYVSGSESSDTAKTTLKTVDGYVYAIPMFRLYRKPSCGKAIPFEYQKINPKVDYSKFTNLMKEERVERIVNETISGKSLVNISRETKEFTLTKNTYRAITNDGIYDSTKDYTIKFKVKSIVGTTTSRDFMISLRQTQYDTGSTAYDIKHIISGTVFDDREIVFKIPKLQDSTSIIRLYLNLNGGDSTNTTVISDLMLLEGDWTNKPFPKYFEGLKSVGEDESLITVKNSILNESSYDPSTGTPKLNTVPGTNYISSDNLIMPTIEGQVKRGEVKVSDLTSFGKVDSLVGGEKVDFTKIKGRTLQNLVNPNREFFGIGATSVTTNIDHWLINKNTASEIKANCIINSTYNLFKPNTKYTLIIRRVNSLNDSFCIYDQNSDSILSGYTKNTSILFTTKDVVDKLLVYISNSIDTTTKMYKDFIILEGDYTNTPLDQLTYIEGIKSVGENENNKVVVKRVGKNLFDYKNLNSWTKENGVKTSLIDDKLRIEYPSGTGSTMGCYQRFRTKPNTDYVISYVGNNGTGIKLAPRIYLTTTLDKSISGTFVEGSLKFNSGSYSEVLIWFGVGGIGYAEYSNIQLEEGTVITSYEPYKEYKQEITLKEPLRSLPNGVCDTIEGNKVIRRVGKIILNGTENWGPTGTDGTTTKAFYSRNLLLGKNDKNLICNNFNTNSYVVWNPSEVEGISLGGGSVNHSGFDVRIKSSKLSSQDAQGFKTWLSQNPTTVYYELANPVEELIEPNYDKESIKTYQLDQPLRAIPNGVKDEIINGKLIRRCAEVIIDNNSNISLRNTGDDSTTISFQCVVPNLMLNSKFICNLFKKEQISTNGIEGIGAGANSEIFIEILRSRLSSNDVDGFKAWLKENPIKVVYELETPIEIPLKEILPSETNFSLARQFNYTDNYLLELPNGVKDTVENGKVTRRVGKITFNGTESWNINADWSTGEISHFWTTFSSGVPSKSYTSICDKFKHQMNLPSTFESYRFSQRLADNSYLVYINVTSNKLSTRDVQGFKTWLSANPVTILYELATPTTEELSGNNNRYCPYHKEDNTYCGSIYVGNGTNDTYTDTVIKSESIVIDTPFRESTGKLVVNDCRYKKTSYGYNTMYIVGAKNNKLNLDNNIELGTSTAVIDLTWEESKSKSGYSNTRVRMINVFFVEPNTTYTINNSSDLMVVIKEFNNLGIGVKDPGWVSCKHTFTTTANTRFITLMFKKSNDSSISVDDVLSAKFTLNLGSDSLAYEDFVPIEKAFEITEENDVEDLRHQVSLTGFNYEQVLNESFDKLLRGEL